MVEQKSPKYHITQVRFCVLFIVSMVMASFTTSLLKPFLFVIFFLWLQFSFRQISLSFSLVLASFLTVVDSVVQVLLGMLFYRHFSNVLFVFSTESSFLGASPVSVSQASLLTILFSVLFYAGYALVMWRHVSLSYLEKKSAWSGLILSTLTFGVFIIVLLYFIVMSIIFRKPSGTSDIFRVAEDYILILPLLYFFAASVMIVIFMAAYYKLPAFPLFLKGIGLAVCESAMVVAIVWFFNTFEDTFLFQEQGNNVIVLLFLPRIVLYYGFIFNVARTSSVHTKVQDEQQ